MMTRTFMEVLHPPRYPSSNWALSEKRNCCSGTGSWTHEQNKLFEDALARYDKETPDRWDQVARWIPGKTPMEVQNHYLQLLNDVKQIEAGRVPCPGYDCSSFTLDWERSYGLEGLKQAYCIGGKKTGARASDQERKKGIPWTEDEHRLFLLGLQKYGKGDWRNISRNFVLTRTPTQVASHAQKYFIRQFRLNSGGKDKRRSSIHDITTANLPDKKPPSPSQSSTLATQQSTTSTPPWPASYSSIMDSDRSNKVSGVFNSPARGGQFLQTHYGVTSYGLKLESQTPHSDSLRDPMDHSRNSLFQMQSGHRQVHG